ncbi:MAG: DNA polymerase III subunit delta' [Deltaproteobacteria bacterium]|nr:DNA polymerase III subunit delta' [Deltaproteobacteria bacterium]
MTAVLTEILDQDTAITTLLRAIESEKVHHAYLFDGPMGVGKELTAVAMSMALNCRVSRSGCGTCRDCRKVISGNHPDVRILSPDDGKRNILIDAVREAQNWICQSPYEGKARVLIIKPADSMNEASANALLKTLEEPRKGNHLILVTAALSSLLPTVRSRCQIVRFRALKENTIIKLLEKNGIDSLSASLLASISDGSMDQAMRYSGDEIKERLVAVSGLFSGIYGVTPENALLTAADLKDRNEAISTLELFLTIMNHVLYARAAYEDGYDVLERYEMFENMGISIGKIVEVAKVIDVTYHMTAINRALVSIKRNNMNPQMAVEGAIISMRNPQKDGLWNRIGK